METRKQSRFAIATVLLKLAVFTALVPGTMTVWVPIFLLLPRIHHHNFSVNLDETSAVLLIALGAGGCFWRAFDFAFKGEGTPAPSDPPKVLVIQGFYKYTRNSMYVSVLMILVGESLLFSSEWLLGYAAAIALGVHLFVELYEEPTLQGKMGAACSEYCQAVPTWILQAGQVRGKDAI
jgi:protein-S-isoprenylcysteine O-methyltransferase Ste14